MGAWQPMGARRPYVTDEFTLHHCCVVTAELVYLLSNAGPFYGAIALMLMEFTNWLYPLLAAIPGIKVVTPANACLVERRLHLQLHANKMQDDCAPKSRLCSPMAIGMAITWVMWRTAPERRVEGRAVVAHTRLVRDHA